MTRLHAVIARCAESVGWPGIVGLGLLAFIAAFYFSTLRPEQLRLRESRGEVAKLEERRSSAAFEEPRTPGDRLAEFYGFFPPSNHVADLLAKIYAAAEQQELSLEQGEYRAVRDNVGRLTRFQVTLPVKGTYPQVRKFVSAALATAPNLSLDSIRFERQKVGDPKIEAKVKLVLYLGPVS